MRICEVVYATPTQQRKAQQAQTVTQKFLSFATPPAVINPHTQSFGRLLHKGHKSLHANIQQVTRTQSPRPAIQKDKINRLADKFSRGEAALQRRVSDDDIVMAMRRADAAKDAQQKIPKRTRSVAISASKY